ncbi:MAG: hypothetical protein K2X81_24740, partial [Candidatus Obscuribacterales bacterium]|nr:hypothetical protein [Candidatus Obscuribacterales bacterium]
METQIKYYKLKGASSYILRNDEFYVECSDGFAASFRAGRWHKGQLFESRELEEQMEQVEPGQGIRSLWRARMAFLIDELSALESWKTAERLHYKNNFVDEETWRRQALFESRNMHIDCGSISIDFLIEIMCKWSLARCLHANGNEEAGSYYQAACTSLKEQAQKSTADVARRAQIILFALADELEADRMAHRQKPTANVRSIEYELQAALKLTRSALQSYEDRCCCIPDAINHHFATHFPGGVIDLRIPGLPAINSKIKKWRWPIMGLSKNLEELQQNESSNIGPCEVEFTSLGKNLAGALRITDENGNFLKDASGKIIVVYKKVSPRSKERGNVE